MTDSPSVVCCMKCGSANVARDATAYWDATIQQWTLGSTQDNLACNTCGEENNTSMVPITPHAVIEHCRRYFPGTNPVVIGLDHSHPALELVQCLQEHMQARRDPIDDAYFAFGVQIALVGGRHNAAKWGVMPDLAKWDGHIGFVEHCMEFACLLHAMPQYDDGVFAYEIAEPYGTHVAMGLLDGSLALWPDGAAAAARWLQDAYSQAPQDADASQECAS